MKSIYKLGAVALVLGIACSAGWKINRSYARINHYQETVASYHRHHIKQFVDYTKPSQKIPYPSLNSKTNRLIVSIKKQRTYVQRKTHNRWNTVYTMYCSTGRHNSTPRGHYHIQNVRGSYFYAPSEHEGGYNFVSWKDNGVYLFHSTPTYKNKKINVYVAHALGKYPSSHGCIHLTLPDSNWLSSNAKTGVSVIIK